MNQYIANRNKISKTIVQSVLCYDTYAVVR